MNYNFSTVCSKQNLVEIRNFVSKTLENCISDRILINQVVLATDEACTNSIIHSNQGETTNKLNIDINFENKRLIIEISDFGKGFEKNKYQIPTMLQILKEGRKNGIGLILVNKIMDKVEFEKNNKKNICRLLKYL